MQRAVLALTMLLLALLVSSASAEIKPYGLIQVWYSHTALDSAAVGGPDETLNQTGFGLRRARIGVLYAKDKLKGFFFFEAWKIDESDIEGIYVDGYSYGYMDAWLRYQFNETFTLWGGRFRGVGCQAGGLTSPVMLDLVSYPLVAQGWAVRAHGPDARTIGTQLDMKFNEVFSASVLLHNGNGHRNGFLAFNNSVNSSPTIGKYTIQETGFWPKLDLGLYAEPVKDLKFGFTYGFPNQYRPQWNNEFVGAMTAYFYYFWSRYRVKVDFANLDSKGMDWDASEDDYTAQGYALTAAAGLNKHFEVVGRYGSFDPNTDVKDDAVSNLSFGVNFSPDPDQPYDHRLQLNYVRRLNETGEGEEIPDPNVIQLVWQVFIH